MLNFIVRFLGSLRCLLTRRPGGERWGGELVRPCFPARQRIQLKASQAEFARRGRRRGWWLVQQGIEAGPSLVLGAVVDR